MNHLLPLKHLSNRYFAMRHGQSLANLQQVIVSDPQNGIDDYGLSEQGMVQVRESVRRDSVLDSDLLIVSSDFRRARESAEIAHEILACVQPLQFDERLRERNFGDWELTSDSAYALVWAGDEINPDNADMGVESPNQVMQRVSAMIYDYESKHSNATILMVSHGDALQILQTAFSKQDASTHRQLQHLQTAEIRGLMV
ncbi:MAG: histidine phosphatase family protein [Gammaproteobacteria bacterium]